MFQRATENEMPAGGWFVVWAESRAEKRVERRLAARGLVSWLPVRTERRRWSDRWKDVEFPLWPGYLFARAGLDRWPAILRTPGVLTVVREGPQPALLADGFIADLRDAVTRRGVEPEPVDEAVDYAPGSEVVVQEGPLSGIRGVVRERRSARQLVIWVAQIGRGVAFTIGTALVRPAVPARKPLRPTPVER